MTLVEKFTAKYGNNPIKLVEEANLKNFENAKSMGLEKLLSEYVDTEDIIIVNNEFLKELVECFAEAGEKFPQGLKATLDDYTELQIPNKKVGTPKPKGTLENFKDIVGQDELRPVLSGVFVSEDGESLVATDAHKMAIQKTNEYSKYAGKIIDLKKYIESNGKLIDFIDEKYPNYKGVIPRDFAYEERALKTYSFYNYVRSAIEVKRLTKSETFSIKLNLMTDTSGETSTFSFGYQVLFDALNFAMLNRWNDFTMRYSAPSRAMLLDFGNDNIILVMPIMERFKSSIGAIPLTPEEITENYGLVLKTKKPSKPAATKPARPSAPVSSEPFKKFEGNIGDTSYISRRQIASITLTNGEVLGANDVIDGFYRVNKKMAHGGGVDQDEPYSKSLYSNKDWESIKRFLEERYTPRQADIIMRSSWMREIGRKENFKNFVLFFNEYKRYLDQMLEEEGEYAHGGSMYADGGNLGKTGTKTYKLRAEGLNDFLAFLQNDMYFKMKYFTIEPIGVPDVVVTFETSSSLSEIKEKLKEVPDSHVMLQTVKPINEYTGEREEEGEYAHGGSMYAGGGYIRPDSDTRVSGKYDFKTNNGLGYELLVVGYERKNDDSDSLYFDDLESKAKKELGSIIIKNNSWKNLSKGQPIVAISETGIKGRLTRIGNLYAHGGSMYAGGGTMGRVKVGTFNEAQLKSGEDKLAIEKAQKETGLTYIDSKVTKKGGKMFMEVYLIPTEEYLKSAKFANGGSMYADKIPSRPFLVEIKPLFKGEEPLVVRVSPDTVGEFTAGYTIYADAKSTKKVGYVTKPEMEGKIENGEYKILSDSNKFANGGSMYAGGGSIGRKGTYTGRIVTTENGEVMIGKISGYRGSGEPVYDVHDFGQLKKDMREKVGELGNNKIKELLKNYAHGGSMSSSHEIGDTVTFNSVMGGTKTGTIISKMGEEGFRIQVGNGFATIKKSAIV